MKTRQHGFTLISLMIGLVLSLVVMIAMLATYKGVIKAVFGNSGSSSSGLASNAKQDGQLSSGMLSAQLALQEAGYGIAGAVANTDFLAFTSGAWSSSTGLLSGTAATIGTSATAANLLVWGVNTTLAAATSSYGCRALLWAADPADATKNSLLLLQASGSCYPLTTAWSTVVWTVQRLVTLDSAAASVTMSANTGAGCWPYGSVPTAISSASLAPMSAQLLVTLGYSYSSNGAANTLSVCLSNFQT